MLRLPSFTLETPTSVARAIELLCEHRPHEGGDGGAMIIAGGTDLVPNMKHELFTPSVVVALGQVAELHGVREDEGELVLGAMTPLDEIVADERVRARAPQLAQAAGVVGGPMHRRMGTIGGNVLLDTRCQWYNQTYFWRESLGFCMKKDGDVCHVVAGGKKCVAAASNDTAPALMTLGAQLVFEGPQGKRAVAIDDFFLADGIFNKKKEPAEILVEVRIPQRAGQQLGAYGKLRDRGSIDFPLLGVAVRIGVDDNGRVADADVVNVALAAKPVRIRAATETLQGTAPGQADFAEAVESLAQAAHKQCKPLPNIPGDHEYRRRMVPVYVRRTLLAAVSGEGPINAL